MRGKIAFYLNNLLLLLAITFSFVSCIAKSKIEVTFKNQKKSQPLLNISVADIQLTNNQFLITGTGLTGVSHIKITEGSTTTNLQIESQSDTSIVANTHSNVTFSAGKIFSFIFSSTKSSITYAVDFSLCASSMGGKSFNCAVSPQDQEVVAYDATSQRWKPKSVKGVIYKGLWDALNDPQPASTTAGEYYVVSVANSPYHLGDWIVYNGTSYDHIDNSQAIMTVFGRTGVVSATEGDYDLTKLSDVTITSPTTDQVLKYNGSEWVNAAFTYTETDPNVTAFAKSALPTCGAGQVLKGNGTSLSCVTDDNTGAAFSGTANRAVKTSGVGALAVSTETDAELGYLSGVTGAIQTQLDAKESVLGTGSVTSTHILDGTIADADLAGSIAQGKITNLTADLAAKQDTSTFAASVRAVVLTGLSTATNAVVAATDTVLVAFGLLQKQITDLDSTKFDKAGGTLIVGTIDGVPSPTAAGQLANKAYVDAGAAAAAFVCPTNYVLVPGDTAYYPKNFCVMKYEAKNDGYGTPVSVAAGTAWGSITRAVARAKCKSLGSGYDLISVDQWQTMAMNIANVATNWSGGVVSSGQLNVGNSGTTGMILAASTDDNDPCISTGQTCSSTVWHAQRRTHVLSNGNVIWDVAGNVWEMTTGDSSATHGADGYMSTMTAGDVRQTRYGVPGSLLCATPGSNPYCGMGYGSFNYTGNRIVLRGGYYTSGTAGIFATNISPAVGGTSSGYGFRCVFIQHF